MRRFFKDIIRRLYFGIGWAMDYLYVAYWQLVRFFLRTKDTMYVHPPQKGTVYRQLILLPGIYENWRFMKPVADHLFGLGYDVHVIKQLGYTTGSVTVLAQIVSNYIDTTQLNKPIIVAHSKGGLVGKYVMATQRQTPNAVQGMVAIHTPFEGSKYARYIPLRSVRLFIPGSSDLTTLATHHAVNNRIVSIYGLFDPHIPGGSYLKGATNIQLDTVGHFKILSEPKVLQEVATAIEQLATPNS